MMSKKTNLKPRIDSEKRLSSQLIQWLLGFLLALLIAGGLWTTVLAGDSLFNAKYKYIPVALRTDKKADYSSNPEYSFNAISIDIVADILEDEAITDNQVSDEQVSEWKNNFFKKLQAPIPVVKSLPDTLLSEKETENNEEDVKDNQEEVKDNQEEVKDKIEDKKEEVKDKIEDKKEEVKDKIENKKEEVKDKIEDKKEEVKDKIENKKEEIRNKKKDK